MWKYEQNNEIRENLGRNFGKSYIKTACNKKGFIPKQRIHINQSPLLFALDIKQTYGHYEKGKGHEHNTWLSTPGEGLTKT